MSLQHNTPACLPRIISNYMQFDSNLKAELHIGILVIYLFILYLSYCNIELLDQVFILKVLTLIRYSVTNKFLSSFFKNLTRNLDKRG